MDSYDQSTYCVVACGRIITQKQELSTMVPPVPLPPDQQRSVPPEPGPGEDPSPEIRAWDQLYAARGWLWGRTPHPALPAFPNALVLELGCGDGKTTAQLVKNPQDLIALDSSPHACRAAAGRVAGQRTADFLTADARAIPLSTGSVDVVVASHVIGHMQFNDRNLLVAEAGRVLKKGGLFHFCDFSVEDFRCGRGNRVEDQTYRRGNGIITHYFTEAEVRSLSDRFSVLSCETRHWILRIRGTDHTRSEISALLARV